MSGGTRWAAGDELIPTPGSDKLIQEGFDAKNDHNSVKETAVRREEKTGRIKQQTQQQYFISFPLLCIVHDFFFYFITLIIYFSCIALALCFVVTLLS